MHPEGRIHSINEPEDPEWRVLMSLDAPERVHKCTRQGGKRGIEERAGPVIFVGFYAPFDPICNDPRFDEILAKVGIKKEWTDKLLKNTDASIKDKAYLLRFNYVPGMARYDNSNTQYALLGLYSAYLCGVKIPPMCWIANAKHWIADQFTDVRASAPLRPCPLRFGVGAGSGSTSSARSGRASVPAAASSVGGNTSRVFSVRAPNSSFRRRSIVVPLSFSSSVR